jgi:type IV secretory pathway TrbL component
MGDLKDSLSEVTLTKLAAIAGAAVGARLGSVGAAVGAFVGYTLASAVQTTGRTASTSSRAVRVSGGQRSRSSSAETASRHRADSPDSLGKISAKLDSVACPECRRDNPSGNFLCMYCGARLNKRKSDD